jgi:hypothetical protein
LIIWRKGGPACHLHRRDDNALAAGVKFKAAQKSEEEAQNAEEEATKAREAQAAGRMTQEELMQLLKDKASHFIGATFRRFFAYLKDFKHPPRAGDMDVCRAAASELEAKLHQLWCLKSPIVCAGTCDSSVRCSQCLVLNDLLALPAADVRMKLELFQHDHSLISLKAIALKFVELQSAFRAKHGAISWDDGVEGKTVLHALLGTEPLVLDGHSLPCALLVRCNPCHHTWQELHDSILNIAPQPPSYNWRHGQSKGLRTALLEAMAQLNLSYDGVERALVPSGFVLSGQGSSKGRLALWSRVVRSDSTVNKQQRRVLTDERVQKLEGMLSSWLHNRCPLPAPPPPPPPPPPPAPKEADGSSGDADDEPPLSSYGIRIVTPTMCAHPGCEIPLKNGYPHAGLCQVVFPSPHRRQSRGVGPLRDDM